MGVAAGVVTGDPLGQAVVEGGFAITRSALTLTGNVPGIAPEEFARIAEEAEKNCPVSKLLDCEITLEHRLES